MAPNHNYVLTDASGEPLSRTYQYRKVMKPMLERKRRARINRCLDELKELMTGALQTEGENVAKLEKADILELTVRHLHTLRRQNQLGSRSENSYAEKFKAGFRHCAAEVTHFLGVMDQDTSIHVLKHLNSCINHLDNAPAQSEQSGEPTINRAVQQQQQQQQHQQAAPISVARPAVQIQSPSQINAHAVGRTQVQTNQMIWQQKNSQTNMAPPQVPIHHQFHTDEQQQKHRLMLHLQSQKAQHTNYNYPNRHCNQSIDIMMESSTRTNTPPMSPKIDVDDSSVWRPW